MRIELHIHGSKEQAWEKGGEAGLEGEPLRMFSFASTEHVITYDVAEDGTAKPIIIDKKPILDASTHDFYRSDIPAKGIPVWQAMETAPKSVADGRHVSGIYIIAFVPATTYQEDEAEPSLESQVCVVWWEPLMKNDKGGKGLWMGEGGYEVHPTQWLCRIDELPQPIKELTK